MKVLLFVLLLLVVSLVINAYIKIKSYRNEDKSVWQDGDSVRIKDASNTNEGFMTRLA